MLKLIKRVQKTSNSIFSINEELAYRLMGTRNSEGSLWNIPFVAAFFYGIIIYLKEHLNLFSLLLIFFCIIIFLIIFFTYKDDSLQYKDTPFLKLFLLSLLFHIVCLLPIILFAITKTSK